MQTIQIFDKTFSPVISEIDIQDKIKILAKKISSEFETKNPLFIAILNGAFMFAADLFRQIQIPATITFVKLSSYSGLQSTGNIETLIGLNEKIEGRNIIILDDVLDTGGTLFTFKNLLQKQNPLSIKTVLLVDKKIKNNFNLVCDYACFENLNGFLIGYGMDYKEAGRNFPCIYELIE